MSHEDQRRRLGLLAKRLMDPSKLSHAERTYLMQCLHEISMGRDANEVFQTKLKKGQKISDIDSRAKISFILHWVACAIEPDNGDEPPMTLTAALERATEQVVPWANRIWGNTDGHVYSLEYLKSCWDNPRYRHMRSLDRTPWDDDFPFPGHN